MARTSEWPREHRRDMDCLASICITVRVCARPSWPKLCQSTVDIVRVQVTVLIEYHDAMPARLLHLEHVVTAGSFVEVDLVYLGLSICSLRVCDGVHIPAVCGKMIRHMLRDLYLTSHKFLQ